MTKTTTMTTHLPRILLALLAVAALVGAAVLGTQVVLAQTDGPATIGATYDDGELPDGATAFDSYAGITNLEPGLLAAVRAAATDAEASGIEVIINSGWRSSELQECLMEQAVAERGSLEEASRWVATPEGSSHVTGDAVDIGGYDAAAWFQTNGARYDLCQTFENEAWHFELRPGASVHGCPATYRDARDDPRNTAA